MEERTPRPNESDNTIEISIGLFPVLALVVVIGGLIAGVWLARGGAAGLGSSQGQTAEGQTTQALLDASSDGSEDQSAAAAPGAADSGAVDESAESGDVAAADAGPAAGDASEVASAPFVVTASPDAEVLALLNGAEITSREVDLELIVQAAIRGQSGQSLNSDPTSIERFRREILEHLLDQRALIAAAAEAGIEVTDLEATAGIPTMGSTLGIDGTALYESALAAGITDAEYLDWVRGQLAIERFLSSDIARQISQEAMVDSGVPADQAAALPVDREAVAGKITEGASIILVVEGDQVAPVVVGEEAPDVELVGLDGQPVRLSDFRGKPVVLNFWATWCVPCRIEMPSLQRAHEQYGDELTILGVDVEESAAMVGDYATALGLTFPLVIDPEADVARLFRVRAMPTTYFIDADGVVIDSHRGAVRSDEELAPLLETVLPGAGDS